MKYSLSAIALALSTNLFAAAPICVNPSVSDPDNDGWGWENNDSCRVGSSPVVIDNGNVLQACLTETGNLEAEISRLNQRIATLEGGTTPGGQSPTCVDTAPQGDGWGWDGSSSCRVGGTPPPAQEIEYIAKQDIRGTTFYVTRIAPASSYFSANIVFDNKTGATVESASCSVLLLDGITVVETGITVLYDAPPREKSFDEAFFFEIDSLNDFDTVRLQSCRVRFAGE